jgi:hypothetical protein
MANTLKAHVNMNVVLPNDTDERSPSTYTTIVALLWGNNSHTHTVIFLHGREDFGENMAKDFLNYEASDLTWKEYEDGGHAIHPRLGAGDVATFLHRVLKI